MLAPSLRKNVVPIHLGVGFLIFYETRLTLEKMVLTPYQDDRQIKMLRGALPLLGEAFLDVVMNKIMDDNGPLMILIQTYNTT